ncbi:MAG: cytochrome c oxidase subunit I [Actinomycetota bacterium]|nr:cytochrome c oxidase subunit I [Actinomycetota bacterium]
MTTTSIPATTVFRRPKAETGFWSWVTTVDHKKIGIMYGYTAFVFFLLGGIEALLLRVQLARPENDFLSAADYNSMFTMHGTTMIFLVIMPMASAFFNYLLPLQIGARDVAFPRLNALSYWIFLFGGIFLYSSFFFSAICGVPTVPVQGNLAGDATWLAKGPCGGWFGYQPNAGPAFSPDAAMSFWAVGLQILGVASIASGMNFVVTIFNLRAPGMRLMRMPVFTWMTLVVSFLLVFAMPILAVALFFVTFDREFGSLFFSAAAGADPLLWQHLFWLFGHPEVYILILPAMGIVSEVLPVFSRKPLFGYAAVVFAGAAIGFIGFGVWAHHMFASGLGAVALSAFGISTMVIAVPTGIKIFNWTATLWRGAIRASTAMLFAVGFVAMFVIGGLSGVSHAVVPSDWQQTDSYYIVAHLHYVLFGGALMGIFAGIYYWFPKVYGRLLSEGLGKLHFWMMLVGFNLTFGPMHILGLQGQPRRVFTYEANVGFDFWNLVATVGAFIIALSILVFMFNWVVSKRTGRPGGVDPWDARTLEWSTPSPPPHYNFAEVPVVEALDDFWHQKYEEDEDGRPVRKLYADAHLATLEERGRHPSHPIHMPSPSYFPLVVASGLPFIGYGIIYHEAVWGKGLIALGALLLMAGLVGWATEPVEEGHGEPHAAVPEPAGAAGD